MVVHIKSPDFDEGPLMKWISTGFHGGEGIYAKKVAEIRYKLLSEV